MAQLTAPISFSKVNTALGTRHTDLGTLVKDENIKMWAKYKPVVWASVNTLGALNSGSTTWNPNCAVNLQWWRGTNGDYGLSYSGAMVSVGAAGTASLKTALTTIASLCNGTANGWTYTKPSGGSSSPYRLQDFLQYNHDTSNPIRGVSVSDVQASSTSNYSITYDLNRTGVSDITQRNYLLPEDITQFSLRLGIAIYKKNGNTYNPIAWAFGTEIWEGMGITDSDQADGIINEDSSKVEARLKDNGVYYVLPIYSTADLPQPAASAGTDYYFNYSAGTPSANYMKLITVPYVSPISFTAHQRTTTQTVGVPELSNKQITDLWTYTTTLYVNSTYAGYSGGNNKSVQMAIVNELYDGTFTSENCAYNDSWTVNIGSNEKKTIVTISPANAITLAQGHDWKVIVWVVTEPKTFPLMSPIRPIE